MSCDSPFPGVAVPAPKSDFGTLPPSLLCCFSLPSASSAHQSSWPGSAAGHSAVCSPALWRRPAGKQEQGMARDRDSLLGQGFPAGTGAAVWRGSIPATSSHPRTGAALSTKETRRDSEADSLEVQTRELRVLFTVLNSPPFLQHLDYFPFHPFP